MSTADTVGVDQFGEVLFSFHCVHLGDERLQLIILYQEHEIGIARHDAGVQGQCIQWRLVAQGLAHHERHVAMGTVAEQGVNFLLSLAALHMHHADFRHKVHRRQVGSTA